jgi:glutamate/tyrosine decarboxylase-like PLP-dependent enzyme
MLTRRRFLGYSGAGLLTVATGCTPPPLEVLADQDTFSSKATRLSLSDKARIAKLKNNFLGYPVNMTMPSEEFFAWRKELQAVGIGNFAYNNVGNPFKESSIPYNTHELERELILRMGKLYAFPPSDIWGFLSHSGTDSNMHGMYMGRTLLKGRTGILPKAYFTKEAHYSIQILRDLLGLETVWVDTLSDGGMDPTDLERKLAENSSYPALVVATVGTTFKGAVDPVDRIRQALKGHASYLHLDAALFGGYLPFTSHADEVAYRGAADPDTPRYESLAVSCHKYFGFPAPAGLFITTKSLFEEFNELFSRIHNPEYIQQVPGTITCSRDAVKPAEFYFFSTPEAQAKLAKDAQTILANTAYLMEQMHSRFSDWQPLRMNELSNIVFFRRPSDRMVKKYSLATMHLEIGRQQRDYAHVVIMPHVTRTVLAEFLNDLEQDAVTLL